VGDNDGAARAMGHITSIYMMRAYIIGSVIERGTS
jgi:hypothetical protein